MFPFLRLARVLASAPARPRIPPLGESVVSFRVLPGDLDQNRHLNNGRYLTMMDLGRFDLIARSGLAGELLKRRWYPVVRAATVRFRQPLDAFQRYDLRTRVVGWDDDGFYLEQRFERGASVRALGLIKGTFLGPEGKVAPATIAALLAPGMAAPKLPAWIETWERSQQLLAEELRRGQGGAFPQEP